MHGACLPLLYSAGAVRHQCAAVGDAVVGDRVVTADTLGARVATALRTLGAHVGGASLGLVLGCAEGAADGEAESPTKPQVQSQAPSTLIPNTTTPLPGWASAHE